MGGSRSLAKYWQEIYDPPGDQTRGQGGCHGYYRGDQISNIAHILSNEAKTGNWWGGWKGGFKGPANFWGVYATSNFPPQGNSMDY